jgi:hypothetical protein
MISSEAVEPFRNCHRLKKHVIMGAGQSHIDFVFVICVLISIISGKTQSTVTDFLLV